MRDRYVTVPPQKNEFTPHSSGEPENNDQGQQAPSSGEDIKQKILPYLWYVVGGTFVIGLIFGMMMAGGGESQPDSRPGCSLNIVTNPDIPEGARFPLCGRTSRAEPCVLYIMNTFQYDKSVEDFYADVQRLTERPVQLISIENPVYSKLLIPPGAFARIKVPSLR